jgi:hypothetical protein
MFARCILFNQTLDVTRLDIEQPYGLPQVRRHLPL